MAKSEEELRQVAMDFAWPELKGNNSYEDLTEHPKKHIDNFVKFIQAHTATVAAEAAREGKIEGAREIMILVGRTPMHSDAYGALRKEADKYLAALNNTQAEGKPEKKE